MIIAGKMALGSIQGRVFAVVSMKSIIFCMKSIIIGLFNGEFGLYFDAGSVGLTPTTDI